LTTEPNNSNSAAYRGKQCAIQSNEPSCFRDDTKKKVARTGIGCHLL